MEPLSVLNDLRIASPCPASWHAMRGDDRVRFCDSCSKSVYNLSDLTAAEATALIRESEGRLCVRLYRRADGTVLTADCPVGLRHALRRRLLRLATVGVVIFATLRSGLALYARGVDRPLLHPAPTGPGMTFTDWADWASRMLGMKPTCRVIMGTPCPIPPPTSGAPGAFIQGKVSIESPADAP
jgi:hypothetical protein